MPEPSYEDVCSDTTGHAEAVRIEYDPSRVSYRELVKIFFTLHDPTQENRQGPDIGSQYRSVIFYHDEEQKREAAAVLEELEKSGRFSSGIMTALVPATEFWPAEEYHQSYYLKIGRRYGNIL
jgi:methionine-S-sulfoxide reductase